MRCLLHLLLLGLAHAVGLHSGDESAAQSSSSERTLYACTGSSLSLECEDDAVIAVTRANYGRFSIAVCNDFGRTDWSVNCFSPASRDILKERCDGASRCEMSTAEFSSDVDPCPGTDKYLEAHYTCVQPKKDAASPPWLRPTKGTHLTERQTARRVPITAPTTTVAVTTTTATTTTTTTRRPTTTPTSTRPPFRLTSTTTASRRAAPVVTEEEDAATTASSGCPSVTERGLRWPRTSSGSVATLPCPFNAGETTTWQCLETGQWSVTAKPDLSRCKSDWTRSWERQQRPLQAFRFLHNTLSELPVMYGGDLVSAVDAVEATVKKMRAADQVEAVTAAVQVLSFLLDPSRSVSWRDLPAVARKATANRLMATAEGLGVVTRGERTFMQQNICLTVRTSRQKRKTSPAAGERQKQSVHQIADAHDDDDDSDGDEEDDVADACGEGDVRVHGDDHRDAERLVIARFHNIDRYLDDESEEDELDDRADSSVLSVSTVGTDRNGEEIALKIAEASVEATIRNPFKGQSPSTAYHCVSWDEVGEAWNGHVCSVVKFNFTFTTCSCRGMARIGLKQEQADEDNVHDRDEDDDDDDGDLHALVRKEQRPGQVAVDGIGAKDGNNDDGSSGVAFVVIVSSASAVLVLTVLALAFAVLYCKRAKVQDKVWGRPLPRSQRFESCQKLRTDELLGVEPDDMDASVAVSKPVTDIAVRRASRLNSLSQHTLQRHQYETSMMSPSMSGLSLAPLLGGRLAARGHPAAASVSASASSAASASTAARTNGARTLLLSSSSSSSSPSPAAAIDLRQLQHHHHRLHQQQQQQQSRRGRRQHRSSPWDEAGDYYSTLATPAAVHSSTSTSSSSEGRWPTGRSSNAEAAHHIYMELEQPHYYGIHYDSGYGQFGHHAKDGEAALVLRPADGNFRTEEAHALAHTNHERFLWTDFSSPPLLMQTATLQQLAALNDPAFHPSATAMAAATSHKARTRTRSRHTHTTDLDFDARASP